MEDTLEVVERLVDEGDVGHFCDWGTNRNAWGEFDWNLEGFLCIREGLTLVFIPIPEVRAYGVRVRFTYSARSRTRRFSSARESRSAWTFLE